MAPPALKLCSWQIKKQNHLSCRRVLSGTRSSGKSACGANGMQTLSMKIDFTDNSKEVLAVLEEAALRALEKCGLDRCGLNKGVV